MTRLEAKRLAISFLIDCVTQCEADGHQQCQMADWQEVDPQPTIAEADDQTLLVTLGDMRVKFTCVVTKGATP